MPRVRAPAGVHGGGKFILTLVWAILLTSCFVYRIRDGKRTLLETEDLGVSILQDLHRQRETITSAREHIHGADDNIGRSRKILQAMGRRALANKAMLYGIIAMLFGAILLVAYFKLFKSSDDDKGGQ